MIELAQHIEVLLLENDCVILPGFGGFVAHYTPAVYIEKEHTFLPPSRTIGFNPQLKINDGVLAQSYMSVHGIGFSEATRMVEKEVDELTTLLHTEGTVSLKNIGELRYNIYGTYEFLPCCDQVVSPALYGLPSFGMRLLCDVPGKKEEKLRPVLIEEKKRMHEMHFHRFYIRNAVAVIAAIALFFTFSTKVENTDVQNNYAQLLPGELFEQIERQSVAFTPVPTKEAVPQQPKQTAVKKASSATTDKATPKPKPVTSRPISIKEVKVAKPQPATVPVATQPAAPVAPATPKTTSATPYHIIVAGGIGMKAAETLVGQLKAKGYTEAQVLTAEEKVRVSLRSFGSREEATRQLLELRKETTYKDAWLLVQR